MSAEKPTQTNADEATVRIDLVAPPPQPDHPNPARNPDFRPNPARAIYVQGKVDQALLDRLTPQIISLQHESRDPITAYIDSPGGSTGIANSLLRLLRATDQEGSKSCRLITIATSMAASAAADLLAAGDYACAYTHSTIIYHGTSRSVPHEMVNLQDAFSLTQMIKAGNDRYAMTLANESIGRFVFRYLIERGNFPGYRTSQGKPNLKDLDCFIGLTSDQLSTDARSVLTRSKDRHHRYRVLLSRAVKKARRTKSFTNPTRLADSEAALLKGIIDFEMSENKADSWSFERGGMTQLSDDFFLLMEYMGTYEHETLRRTCERWGEYFLTQASREELEQIQDESPRDSRRKEIIKEHIRPIWLLLVALCHALQEGENELSAADAYWLGLIDEVIGIDHLFSVRMLVEGMSGALGPPKQAES